MHDYYCKNCNYKIGKWNYEYKWYDCLNLCNLIESKNFNKINFLDCKKCNKFVGLLCRKVCENCFGKEEIFEEKNLFNFFLKYIKLTPTYKNYEFNCEICDNEFTFRWQHWFFEELTFYK